MSSFHLVEARCDVRVIDPHSRLSLDNTTKTLSLEGAAVGESLNDDRPMEETTIALFDFDGEGLPDFEDAARLLDISRTDIIDDFPLRLLSFRSRTYAAVIKRSRAEYDFDWTLLDKSL